MKFVIKSWYNGCILFSLETSSMKLCLEAAVKSGADLRGADLSGAVLSGADLSGAVLSGADLRDADTKFATDEEATQNLDAIREIILEDQARLNMGHWHASEDWKKRTCAEEAVCGTTHCMAGWLQVCATDPEVRAKPAHIAGVIQAPIAAKMFYRDNDTALEWLRDRKYVAEMAERAQRKAEREAKKAAQ